VTFGLPAGVLGQSGIIVVDLTSIRVENYILQYGAELDGVENIGFLLGRQTDALGIAL
jgi:hypothetical protein